jgi:hypothetical protein
MQAMKMNPAVVSCISDLTGNGHPDFQRRFFDQFYFAHLLPFRASRPVMCPMLRRGDLGKSPAPSACRFCAGADQVPRWGSCLGLHAIPVTPTCAPCSGPLAKAGSALDWSSELVILGAAHAGPFAGVAAP